MRSLKSNLLAVHGFRPAPIFVRRRCKYTHLFSNNKQNMKKIIVFFKNWLFNVRKKNAIKKAQQLANEQRRKFLVLNFKGKPTVVSMKQIKFWISTKQVNKDADYFREMALYTAMPK